MCDYGGSGGEYAMVRDAVLRFQKLAELNAISFRSEPFDGDDRLLVVEYDGIRRHDDESVCRPRIWLSVLHWAGVASCRLCGPLRFVDDTLRPPPHRPREVPSPGLSRQSGFLHYSKTVSKT